MARLSEEQVEMRLWAARHSVLFKQRPVKQQRALVKWAMGDRPGDKAHHWPAALRAIGVRWTGDHYEEAHDGD